MASKRFSPTVMFSDPSPGSALQIAVLRALKLTPGSKAEALRVSLFYFILFRTSRPCPLKHASANRGAGKSFAGNCLINHSVLLFGALKRGEAGETMISQKP